MRNISGNFLLLLILLTATIKTEGAAPNVTKTNDGGANISGIVNSQPIAVSAAPNTVGTSGDYYTPFVRADGAPQSIYSTVVSAVSRKTHGATGSFDAPLPLAGAVGVECRNPTSGMSHQVVVTFSGPVSVSAVSVAGESGSPMATATASGTEVTVSLSAINNAQRLTITLTVMVGANSGNVVIPMGILLGDNGGNGSVSSSDISQTKAASGQAISASNFRSDINLSGGINSSDIGVVKAQAGATLPPIPTAHAKAAFDYDGDGRTDYVVVRNTGGGNGGAVTWFIRYAAGGGATVPFGIATDVFLGGDYDGDGKTDVAVWRPGFPGTFLILLSSNGQLKTVSLGTSLDDATVWGDYDGDGKTDVAIFQTNPSTTPPSFIYLASSTNNQSTITLPIGGVIPSPGDYDGDGKADACVHDTSIGSQFVLRRSSDGAVEMIPFGDVYPVVPGDYDGDGKTDFAQTHSSGGQLLWDFLYRAGGGTSGTPIPFGASTDFTTQGDYDGDGRADLAVWKSSTGTFSIRRSSDGVVTTFPWGADGDYPVANSNTH